MQQSRNNEKIIQLNTIEYINGKSYNYHDHVWSADKYRVVRKNNDIIGAYVIDSVEPNGNLGVMYMTKYLKNIQLARSVIKKGTVEYEHYYLKCQKDFTKNNNLKNEFYRNEEFTKGFFSNYDEFDEITSSYALHRDLTQICKHTYRDRTNDI
ncbi:hypothetical protein A3K93_08495 [Acinetobacter sp. NCu2D-2]|uniref:hypothetical protein n=1 Tax=Acinetobacter sp. NCu2D-2 TaxID=1608473 RepID=UPI0007CDB8D4|nr:hypothetical protein [Acinetobacter sp. NCu2D-2]ANF82232.1 hypothetical protein A3K93_08495 [Acinetobacter sp. NCu2D-2]